MAVGKTNSKGEAFPVNAIYISLDDTNPANIFGYGTWVRVAQGQCLWGASANGQAGTTKAAGLPNIAGGMNFDTSSLGSMWGALTDSNVITSPAYFTHPGSPQLHDEIWGHIEFNASKSNAIYGNSATVQPPALVVNIWKRTA